MTTIFFAIIGSVIRFVFINFIRLISNNLPISFSSIWGEGESFSKNKSDNAFYGLVFCIIMILVFNFLK